MGLADYVSRLTSLFALLGQFLLLFSLPMVVTGGGSINWLAFLLLIFSPHLAMLSQLGLPRVREVDVDLTAVALTGDPRGLAAALVHIERESRSWRNFLMPGWGNPELSWLSTHPETEERIRRLHELVPAPEPFLSWPQTLDLQPGGYIRRWPRWTVGGLWW